MLTFNTGVWKWTLGNKDRGSAADGQLGGDLNNTMSSTASNVAGLRLNASLPLNPEVQLYFFFLLNDSLM